MKHATRIFSLLAALTAAPAIAHMDHGKPQFGGVVAEAGMAQFEIVGAGNEIVVHVTQHGEPVNTTTATARLVVLDGANKSEILLKPAGSNLFKGAGKLPSGAKLMLNASWPAQKPMQARAVVP